MMRTKIGASVLAAALAVSGITGEHDLPKHLAPPMPVLEYTSMSAAEQTAFELVATQCRADVERLCRTEADPQETTERDLSIPPVFHHHLMQSPPTTTGHHAPFVTFHRNPLEDFDSFLDHFLQPPPFLFMTDTNNGRSDFLVIVEERVRPRQMEGLPPCPFDIMMRQVISSIQPEHFTQVSQQMNDKGNSIVQDAGVAADPQIVATARRLQEVSPETLHMFRRDFLPFAPHESDCLDSAYNNQVVSKGCGSAFMQLRSFRTQERQRIRKQVDQDQEMVMDYINLWVLVIGIAAMLAIQRRNARKQRIALGDRIFAAVYSKPALKSAVEVELGHTVGHVPPIPFRRNLMRGKLRQSYIFLSRVVRCTRVWILAIFLFVAYLAPVGALHMALSLAAFSFGMIAYTALVAADKKEPFNMCVCCCCGVSTENVKKGNLTAEQACCNCCSGTGVCSVQCASCCNESSCACCGGAGCCCCSKGTLVDGESCCSCKEGSCCCSKEKSGVESGGCCCKDGCTCCTMDMETTTSGLKKQALLTKRTVLSVDDSPAIYTGVPIQVV